MEIREGSGENNTLNTRLTMPRQRWSERIKKDFCTNGVVNTEGQREIEDYCCYGDKS